MIKYVYANSYLTSFDFDSKVMDIIKECGNLDELKSFNNRFEEVPDELLNMNDDMYSGFIDGLVFSQYTHSLSSGNYLNPMLLGLSLDYSKWFKIMKNDDVIRDIVFVDVPYEKYCKLVPSSLLVDKGEYNTHNDAIRKLTDALTESLRTTLH